MNMIRLQTLKLLGLVGLLAGLGACGSTEHKPQITHDGLVEVEGTPFAGVYGKPGVGLSAYTKFSVTDCQVAFRKNWLRDQNDQHMGLGNRMLKSDVDRIRTSLAEMCSEAFSSALTEAPAYTLVAGAEADHSTLILRPSIINLDITAPDTHSASRVQSYTTGAGEMTLYLEILDASTAEVLYRIVDRQRDRGTGYMQWSSSVTNRADASRILNRWSQQLRASLDRVLAADADDN